MSLALSVQSKRVPVIGDIPILGYPFRSEKTETTKSELLILITPRVIYGDKLIADMGLPAGDQPYLSYNDYGPYDDTFRQKIPDLTGKETVKAAPITQ